MTNYIDFFTGAMSKLATAVFLRLIYAVISIFITF